MAAAGRAPVGVQVQGLDELRRRLRRLGPEQSKRLGTVNRAVAQLVVDAAKRRARLVSPQAAKASETLRALGAARAAQVALGSSRRGRGFELGAEFGSIRHRQFPAFRGSDRDAGYWLYPTIRDEEGRIVDAYGEALDDLIDDVF